jgi:hypothetical protein
MLPHPGNEVAGYPKWAPVNYSVVKELLPGVPWPLAGPILVGVDDHLPNRHLSLFQSAIYWKMIIFLFFPPPGLPISMWWIWHCSGFVITVALARG